MIDALGYEKTYAYDANGNKVKETTPKGNETSYEYDKRNALIKMKTPLGNETMFNYDGNSNVVEEIKPDGSKKTNEYDEINRVYRTSYNPDNRVIDYSYDANGNVTKIVTVTGAEAGTITREYDENNRLTSLSNDFNGNFTKQITYAYDGAWNRISMTAGGGVSSYTYDKNNQITTIENKFSEPTSYEYDDAGRRTQKTFDNGMNASYEYDDAGNLLSLDYYLNSGSHFAGFHSNYDNNRNRLSTEEIFPSLSGQDTTMIVYEYDNLEQLVAEKIEDGTITEYIYDEDRNRKQKVVDGDTTHNIYDSDGQLSATGSITNLWDKNGNLVTKLEGADTTILNYNFPNKIDNVVLPDDSTVQYSWSGLWNRMAKTASPTLFALNDCQ